MQAFKAALDAGLGIELDVHLTKDEQIVVMHDSTTGRTMDQDFVISEKTYDELKALRLKLTKEPLPRLREVLALVKDKVPVLIELKADNSFSPRFPVKMIELLEQTAFPEKLALQSFNPYLVKALRKGQNLVPVGQLLSDNLPGQSKFVHFMYRTLLVLHISKPDFFSYDVDFIHKRVIKRRRKKLPLLAWTIDNKTKYQKAKQFADNIIFEHIEL